MSEDEMHKASMAIQALVNAMENLADIVEKPSFARYVYGHRHHLEAALGDLQRIIWDFEINGYAVAPRD